MNRDISKPVFGQISKDCIIPCPSRRLLAWELRRPNLGNFFCTDAMLPGEHVNATQEKIIQDIRDSLGERCSEIVQNFLASLSESSLRDLYENINAELTTANGRIVQHSPVILATTCCNQNSEFLGDEDQSYAAMFYLSDYFGKNKVALEQILSTFKWARKRCEQQKSTAEDVGTVKRDSQYIISKMVNKLDGGAEFADVQMIAAMLGYKAEISTDKFGYFNPHTAAAYSLHRMNSAENKDADEPNDDNSSRMSTDSISSSQKTHDSNEDRMSTDSSSEQYSDMDVENSALDEEAMEVETDEEEEEGEAIVGETEETESPQFSDSDEESCENESGLDATNLDDEESPSEKLANAPELQHVEYHLGTDGFEESEVEEDLGRHNLYEVTNHTGTVADLLGNEYEDDEKSAMLLVNVNDHWQYRGFQLRNLCREEYHAIIQVSKKDKRYIKHLEDNGEPPSGWFPFADGHPLRDDYAQQIRWRHQILIFTGHEPPFPGEFPSGETEDKIEKWKKRLIILQSTIWHVIAWKLTITMVIVR